MKTFINLYENALPDEICDDAIKYFDKALSLGFGHTRQDTGDMTKTKKDDEALFPCDILSADFAVPDKIITKLNEVFWSKYKDYSDEYAVLNDLNEHTIFGHKLQKTRVGSGYHIWHCEHNKHTSKRLLAYIFYLNDVDEGGETEFLYQHMRVKPKKGSLVIWPASFTHTHRGNPPLSNDKYIVTGWVEF